MTSCCFKLKYCDSSLLLRLQVIHILLSFVRQLNLRPTVTSPTVRLISEFVLVKTMILSQPRISSDVTTV